MCTGRKDGVLSEGHHPPPPFFVLLLVLLADAAWADARRCLWTSAGLRRSPVLAPCPSTAPAPSTWKHTPSCGIASHPLASESFRWKSSLRSASL